MVQGGYYFKGFAKHGPLHNPHAYGYFDADRLRRPQARRPRHPRRDHLQGRRLSRRRSAAPSSAATCCRTPSTGTTSSPDGSTFRGRHGGTLIDARDPWFRPIDLLARARRLRLRRRLVRQARRHLDPRDTWDKTNGRIYRVVYGERRKVPPFDLLEARDRRAGRPADQHRTTGSPPRPAASWPSAATRRSIPELEALLADDRDETVALRDLWALHVSGGLDDATALGLLDHPVAGVRRWTVRLLGDDHRMNPSLAREPASPGRDRARPDSSAASSPSSCQRWDADDALPILGRLARSRRGPTRRRRSRSCSGGPSSGSCGDDRDGGRRPAARPRCPAAAAGPRGDPRAGGPRPGLARAPTATSRRVPACWPPRRAGARSARLVAGMEKGLEGRKLARRPARAGRPAVDGSGTASAAPPASADPARGAAGRARRRSRRPPERVADPRAPDADRTGADRAPRPARPARGRARPRSSCSTATRARPSSSPRSSALGAYDRPEVADGRCSRAIRGRRRPSATRILGLLCTPTRLGRRARSTRSSGEQIPAKDLTAGAGPVRSPSSATRRCSARLEAAWGRSPGPARPRRSGGSPRSAASCPRATRATPSAGKPVFKEHCAVCHSSSTRARRSAPT